MFLVRSVRSEKYNRFMDVLPHKRTQVPLEMIGNDPTSVYINANYVHNFDGSNEKYYIAAMGFEHGVTLLY